MIINRRTSFTNLEYPNPFEDPEWTTWASIPNKEAVATASAGQSIAYKVPDGASGWYAMRVVPSGTDANSKVCASWGYTYLHEGSVVYLWCNNGSTPALSRKSLGANGSGGALGGAAGVVCGFKETSDIGDENYGTYSTHMPVVVASGTHTFRRWKITFSDGRETIRYTRGSANWDPNTSATAAIYCLINNAPCLSFEDPSSIMGATGATVTDDGTETFDGIYLGTTPMEFYSTGFSAVAGLIVGQSGSANGLGGGALGSSTNYTGSTGTFGAAPSDNSNGGIAFFDFSREVFESNERKELSDSETAGAYLYKTTEEGHDTTEPYAQRFTAPASLENCEFTFYVNGTEYEFPAVWPDANKQRAFTGDYVTYITGVHLGDTLTVVAEYASGKKAGGIYTITMHSLVYGLYLGRYEFLWKEPGDYSLILPGGTYQAYVHGAGGAGGETGGSFYNGYSVTGGVGGRGGKGLMKLYSFTLPSDTQTEVHVGSAGLTYSNGGNGGARGAAGDNAAPSSGAGGGGGEPSYVLANDSLCVGEGGGGGGGGGGAATNNRRYDNGGAGGGGGGYYIVGDSLIPDPRHITKEDITLYIGGDGTSNFRVWLTEPSVPHGYLYISAGTQLYANQTIPGVSSGYHDPSIYSCEFYVTNIDGTNVTFDARSTGGSVLSQEYEDLTVNDLLATTISSITSVAGKDGTPASHYGVTGANGIAGNQDIPVYSGKGGNGSWAGGGAIATGGGASGSAGGGGGGNDNTFAGGTGGGGAGGCLDAGGGGNATNTAYSGYNSYIFAYNAGAVVPTYSENYLGETVTSGWGMGGTTNMNGTDGWVYLVRCEDVTAYLNLGSVFLYTPTDVSDAGLIDEPDDEQADASLVTDLAGWTKYSMYQLGLGTGNIMKYDSTTFLTIRRFTENVNIGTPTRPNYQTRYYLYFMRGAATWNHLAYVPYTTNGMQWNGYIGLLYYYNGSTNIVGGLIGGRSDGAIQTGPQTIMTLPALSGYVWTNMFYKNGECHLFGYVPNGGAYHIAKFTNGQPDPVITAIPSLTRGNWYLWIYAPTINQENGGAVVCLDPGYKKVCISQDSDGLTWSDPVTALPQGHNWNNLNFIEEKNLLVITSSDKYLSVSSDGINWSEPVYDPETPSVPMYYDSESDCIVGAGGNTVSGDRTYRRIKADELTTINKLDAGSTLIPITPTDYITCGSVEDAVTDIQNMGNIIGDLNG